MIKLQIATHYRIILLSFVTITILFFTAGCGILKKIDNKLGQGFEKVENANFDEVIDFISKKEDKQEAEEAEEVATTTFEILTLEQKEKIDNWLAEHDLNKYGDPIGTMYTGGTPLFSEASGESTDRFEYILDKYNDILNKIENNTDDAN